MTLALLLHALSALLLVSFHRVVHAAEDGDAGSTTTVDESTTSGGGGSGLTPGQQVALISASAGTAFLAVLAVGFFLYRRRHQQPTAFKASTAAMNGRGKRTSPRMTARPTRNSSIMLRQAVSNSKAGHIGAPTASMKRGGRRKGAPTAIMVEVPPTAASMGPSVATPSGTGNSGNGGGAQLQIQQHNVGLHVPPSPAYDFRGRANEMPVTPRTPCMAFPNASNAGPDRMV